MRNKAEKRHNDWKKAIRKKKIINAYGQDYYNNLHQYSKNKNSLFMSNVQQKN